MKYQMNMVLQIRVEYQDNKWYQQMVVNIVVEQDQYKTIIISDIYLNNNILI
jgi:hypothetical protein